MLDLLAFLFGLLTPSVFVVLVLLMYPPTVTETIFLVSCYTVVAGLFGAALIWVAKRSNQ